MKGFSQKKFIALDEQAQHKKCSEWIRMIIESPPQNHLPLLEHYEQLCRWMHFEPLKGSNLEILADRYHAHLALCGRGLKEDGFLKLQQDRQVSLDPPLDVIVYLDGVRSAHNIGSIIRSAEFFGLGQVALSPAMTHASHLQVKRAAMKCEQWIPVLEHIDLELCPRPWVALETSEQAFSLDHFIFPQSFTLIVGNEEYGCRSKTIENCDRIVKIPQHGRKNSLNVSCAFSICAFEIRRQWRQQSNF